MVLATHDSNAGQRVTKGLIWWRLRLVGAQLAEAGEITGYVAAGDFQDAKSNLVAWFVVAIVNAHVMDGGSRHLDNSASYLESEPQGAAVVDYARKSQIDRRRRQSHAGFA
jgi:hypothetical protein